MNNPLVSVIIPIYNVEKYLRQCVDSVLQQTYRNLEIILVDDGSPDNSPVICDYYAEMDSRIKVIHKQNGGISDARNVGIDSANGAFIFFLDADDYLAPECIGSLVDASRNGSFAISGYLLDLSGKDTIYEAEQACGYYWTINDYLFDFYKLFATKFNFVWGKLYRKDILIRNRITFSASISLAEDLLFNLEYYRYCDKGINAISYKGYYYRQHGSTTLSKRFNPKMFDWNELSYTAVRNFLQEYNCFTDQNREHLYRNIAGNYQYGFYLIANNSQLKFSEKESMIKRYVKTPIYQDSLTVKRNKRFDYSLMQGCLKHGMVKSYILLENLKKAFVSWRS